MAGPSIALALVRGGVENVVAIVHHVIRRGLSESLVPCVILAGTSGRETYHGAAIRYAVETRERPGIRYGCPPPACNASKEKGSQRRQME